MEAIPKLFKSTENPSKVQITKDFVKKWGPMLGFLGGVGWDTVTLGRLVSKWDLIILGAYLIVGFLTTLLFTHKHSKWAILAYHFCLGTLLSAMVIVYGKSASSMGSYLLVGGVAGVMIWNEFWGEDRFDSWLRHLILWLACTMYLQFLIPHLVNSISNLWVFVALFVSSLTSMGFAKLQGLNFKKSLVILNLVWVVLWMIQIFPPVPLVFKKQYLGVDFVKSKYSVMNLHEDAHWSDDEIELTQGQRLYFLSSVFAPDGVSADLEHRWFYKQSGSYQLVDAIPLSLKSGGRENGWRFYSWKQNLQEGDWLIETALKDGAVISQKEFVLTFGTSKTYERVLLD